MARVTTMLAKRSDHIVNGKTHGFRIGEHARDEGTQPTLVLARRVRLRRRRADERSDAALRFDDPGTLEFCIDARDRVGVDTEINRELADGWQLVARTQAASGDCRAQPAFELGVNWRRVARVEGNDAHVIGYTSALLQCGQACQVAWPVDSDTRAPRQRASSSRPVFEAPTTGPHPTVQTASGAGSRASTETSWASLAAQLESIRRGLLHTIGGVRRRLAHANGRPRARRRLTEPGQPDARARGRAAQRDKYPPGARRPRESAVARWMLGLTRGFRFLYAVRVLFALELVAMLLNFVLAPPFVVLPVLVK
jgi:hypothetical protein